MVFYKKDKLIFISHYVRKNKLWFIVDYNRKQPDPYFNQNIWSTWICRNTKSNSMQNLVNNIFKKYKKLNKKIYIIFYWNTKSSHLAWKISLILQVKEVYSNHYLVFDKYDFPNILMNDNTYKKRISNPFIVWEPYMNNSLNGYMLPYKYIMNLTENEKQSTWKWKDWNIEIFLKNVKRRNA